MTTEFDDDKKIVTLKIEKSDFWNTKEETIEVDSSLVEGDSTSGIRFEVNDEELKSYPEYYVKIKEKGARIFITEDDDYLVIHSPDSLKFCESIIKLQDYEEY